MFISVFYRLGEKLPNGIKHKSSRQEYKMTSINIKTFTADIVLKRDMKMKSIYKRYGARI